MLDRQGFDVNPGGPPIQAGTPIFDVNGKHIGTVAQKGVQGDHLVLARGWIFEHDVDIPLGVVHEASPAGIYLSISKDQVEHRDWGTTQ
jgi:hypothetical protein